MEAGVGQASWEPGPGLPLEEERKGLSQLGFPGNRFPLGERSACRFIEKNLGGWLVRS